MTEQEELIALEQVLRRQIATEKEEIERLRAEIADIQRSELLKSKKQLLYWDFVYGVFVRILTLQDSETSKLFKFSFCSPSSSLSSCEASW